MSFREMKVFTEHLRSLGYPQLMSMEAFRTPNFDLMARVLYWLIKSYEPLFQANNDFATEAQRVNFVKSVAAFLATKARINLNTRNLYKSDAYSVKELLKITSLLCEAKKAPDTPDSTIGAPPLELASKLQKLKQCRTLATQITEKGAEIFDLLGQEMESKEIRQKVISKPFELEDIEKSVKTSVENLKKQLKETMSAFENLQADESNLVSKIEKKKIEFDRAEKRLKSLQGVRPAYMDEYERIEKDLVGIYETYMDKFRNLAFLENQLDDYNRDEQEKFNETEDALKRMQNRLREEELNILRGDKGSGNLGDSGSFGSIGRPSRPAAASSRGRLSTRVNPGHSDSSGDDGGGEDGISLESGEESSDDGLGDEGSSELIQGMPSGKINSGGQRRPQGAGHREDDSDEDDSLEIGDDDDDDDEEDDNDF